MMAVLICIALFWGNCFSCPQVLLGLKAHQPAHGCCHKTKQTTKNCTSQALQHFVKADAASHAPAVPVVALVVEPSVIVAYLVENDPAHVDHAPPGRAFSLRI